MFALLIGLALLGSSFMLELGPQFFERTVQYSLEISCIIIAMGILFRPKPKRIAKSSKIRDACIGFSILIPAAITWFFYKLVVDSFLRLNEPMDELFFFLSWAFLVVATLPLWGELLLAIGIISRPERKSFRTWRQITT